MTDSTSNISTQQVLFIKDMNLVLEKLNQKPQHQVLSLSIVAHLLSNRDLLELYGNSKENWALALPSEISDIQDAALLMGQIHSDTAPHFIVKGDSRINELQAKYKGSSMTSFGKIRVLFVESALNFTREMLSTAPQATKLKPKTSPPKNPANDLDLPDWLKERLAFLPSSIEEFKKYRETKEKLLDLKTPYRTLMDPTKKPYQREMSDALSVRTHQVSPNHKPLPIDFDYRSLKEEEVIQCEGIFYSKMMDELQGFLFKNLMIPGLKPSIVRDKNIHAWALIGDSMTHYFRQAVGYSYKNKNFIFMKFRKYVHAQYVDPKTRSIRSNDDESKSKSNSSLKGTPGAEPWPDNSKEYQIMDGGSNYFQFHCDMNAQEVFHAFVHGEA